ncbi:hypothetical protein [Streptomyces huiliensis]|uniref:hypothetical protein n=1 Tax=Streptomyces huiliensis TaxID=2876027 RepID=UPI001CBC95ED|nr:hypothetical protein [Streptomyces huiliensis]MBZ4322477.1 hypothetical protein [Streptomyces huiliensis]
MNEPTVRVEDLPEPAVALLRAVLDALSIPLPTRAGEDEDAYTALTQTRVIDVRATLTGALNFGQDVNYSTWLLRWWTEQHPVTYTPRGEAGGAA